MRPCPEEIRQSESEHRSSPQAFMHSWVCIHPHKKRPQMSWLPPLQVFTLGKEGPWHGMVHYLFSSQQSHVKYLKCTGHFYWDVQYIGMLLFVCSFICVYIERLHMYIQAGRGQCWEGILLNLFIFENDRSESWAPSSEMWTCQEVPGVLPASTGITDIPVLVFCTQGSISGAFAWTFYWLSHLHSTVNLVFQGIHNIRHWQWGRVLEAKENSS